MNHVLGIGETVFDIVFRDGKPVAGVPGGSVFNGLITLGRLGIPGLFISETGDDQVGEMTVKFLHDNGICADYLCRYSGSKSCISLAFLDENNDAHYSFYKDYANYRLDLKLPPIERGDVVLFGSYYALNPVLREQVLRFLTYAKENGAILYYDLNFRNNHKPEADALMPVIKENFRLADIVRASADDLRILFDSDDTDVIYRDHVEPYCKRFICTCGSSGVRLLAPGLDMWHESRKVETVSTIGAGDNFNAGIAFGIVRSQVESVASLDSHAWNMLLECGIDLGTEACMTTDNYVSREFAASWLSRR